MMVPRSTTSGLPYRPLAQTFTDTVDYLRSIGRLSPAPSS